MEYVSMGIAIAAGLAIGLFIALRKAPDHKRIHILNKKDFVENMRKGQLIDIRKKEEYEKEKIKGSRNFKKGQLTGKSIKLRKDLSVYIYCNNGKKSYRLAKTLSKEGFIALYVLENGFDGYK